MNLVMYSRFPNQSTVHGDIFHFVTLVHQQKVRLSNVQALIRCPVSSDGREPNQYIYRENIGRKRRFSKCCLIKIRLSFAEMWRYLEPVIQSEISQKEKNKYHTLMHIYGIQKNGTLTLCQALANYSEWIISLSPQNLYEETEAISGYIICLRSKSCYVREQTYYGSAVSS